jgi:hypothetical protein
MSPANASTASVVIGVVAIVVVEVVVDDEVAVTSVVEVALDDDVAVVARDFVTNVGARRCSATTRSAFA